MFCELLIDYDDEFNFVIWIEHNNNTMQYKIALKNKLQI